MVEKKNDLIEKKESLHKNQQSSDGALKTYIYTSLLNWQALTPEQKEQACKEMVRIAHEEIEMESSDN